jgi:cellulose synthase/poly-beta-1,6-N-acetylglucosamine synthase-like glycosyltransferase
MSKPKVSVLMSVRDGERFLSRSVPSILDQTFDDFEFIIVDDGSVDGTRGRILEFADMDSRVVPLALDSNIGLTAALNLGLEKARGEYIARQDADDLSAPRRLDCQVEFLDSRLEIGVCGTRFWVATEDWAPVFSFSFPKDDVGIKRLLKRGVNPIAHGSAMFRRSALEGLSFPRYRFRYGQDYDLWSRFSEKTRLAVLPEELYLYRRGRGSVGVGVAAARSELKGLMLALSEERRRGGSESLDWSLEEERILSEFGGVEEGEKMKSYSGALLELLLGNRVDAKEKARLATGNTAAAVGFLASLPFGTAIARTAHLALSPYSGVKWADAETARFWSVIGGFRGGK